MIGADYPPISFKLFGLDLIEPTDFIFNLILAFFSLLFAYRVYKSYKTNFAKLWSLFFLLFGISSIGGAFSHSFFNYFFVYGKIPGWLLVPFAIYLVEKAMIIPHWNKTLISKMVKFYKFKMFAFYLIFFLMYFFIIKDKFDYKKLFLPIAINTIVGLLIGVGVFGYSYYKNVEKKFKPFVTGILILIPSAFIFLLKINIHPWFTKNDFSHLLMVTALFFFYKGVMNIEQNNIKIPLVKPKKTTINE